MSLRACLQKIETQGMVDFTLGGHTCERPAHVMSGQADDQLLSFRDIVLLMCLSRKDGGDDSHGLRFTVAVKDDNPMCWRPNNVQLKSLKQSNVASFVPAKLLVESEALDLVSWLVGDGTCKALTCS